MDAFAEKSGLYVNMSKSAMFIAGVPGAKKLELLADMGVQEGKVPVRYLGVPLTAQ